MHGRVIGYGCLSLLFSALVAPAAHGQETVSVRSRVFDVEYAVNEDAQPLDSVQLWYTPDRGATWHFYGLDEDRQSPVRFHAPQEGPYGFFLIVSNATGASSGPPGPSTPPQQWAFVDDTPPVVQLHPLRQTTSLGRRILQIRWTAIDTHLTARPIEVFHQKPQEKTWHAVTPDPLANTGRYDWSLPEHLTGSVALRVAARDEGGHLVHSEPQVVEIVPLITADAPESVPAAETGLASPPGLPDPTALPGSKRARERARRLLGEAVVHRDRSEYREGIMRLREAVKLDPQLPEAFAEMAAMLYRIGDTDRALNAYEIALQQRPTMRAALRGTAIVYSQRHDYASAAQRLRTILRYNPHDAETWMNLGDIAVYQGDEVLARECYLRATQIDPEATRVIEQAGKRLTLMADVSRSYQPTNR